MRTVFMSYLKGTLEAVDFYCKAFNASPKNCFKAADGDNFYAHAEIAINDQTFLAVSESSLYDEKFIEANNMQFWLTFDDEQALRNAYDVLKENAEISYALAPCEWCPMMADLTDKFGNRWCLNIF